MELACWFSSAVLKNPSANWNIMTWFTEFQMRDLFKEDVHCSPKVWNLTEFDNIGWNRSWRGT
jgi:hypothetical protein